MSSASSTVTYTSVYTDSEPGRVFWGADEELSDGDITTTRIVMANPNLEDPNVLNEGVPEEDPNHLLDYDEEEDPEMDTEERIMPPKPMPRRLTMSLRPRMLTMSLRIREAESETSRTEVALLGSEAKIGKK
nr:hypothetical protein [Tanacetum cinerariifolium]